MYYYNNVGDVVDKYIFENKTQMNSQKVINIIVNNGGVMTKTLLYKSTRNLTKREREAIIDDLLESNMVSRNLESIDGEQILVFRIV